MARYELQPDRSLVHVFARSTLRPFTGAGPISGHLDVSLRDGRLDLDQPCAGELRLRVDDLTGDVPHLDRELRNRMDSIRYPTVTAVLREVRPGAAGAYHMSGELTLRGRTKLVSGDATLVVEPGGPLTLRGVLHLDMRDFGLVPPRLLVLRVHPQIEVRLGVTAVAVRSADVREAGVSD
jgi:polyisoprenoid-binding protein YceI